MQNKVEDGENGGNRAAVFLFSRLFASPPGLLPVVVFFSAIVFCFFVLSNLILLLAAAAAAAPVPLDYIGSSDTTIYSVAS